MSTRVETTIRQWSTPVRKVVEGQPPGPEDNPITIHAESHKSNIRTITPNYKYGSERTAHEIDLGSTSDLPEAVGDYKIKETQDHYKLQMIDPKVTSNANMPLSSQTVPAAVRRNIDFPSEHSKRSFLKLDPLEKRRIRSVETRPITTSAYLTESLDRHREMEASRLKDYLKAKENEANKPWNKPNWPGPKGRDEQSLRELEEIKKTIETLQKKFASRAQSMNDLFAQPSRTEFTDGSQPDVSADTRGIPNIYFGQETPERPFSAFELTADERIRRMQENQRKQRVRSQTPQYRYPQVSFNGPFFKIEEVGQRQRSHSTNPLMPVHELVDEEAEHEQKKSERYYERNWRNTSNMKIGERIMPGGTIPQSESSRTNRSVYEDEETPNVVIWPPPKNERSPTASPLPRNLTDPERIQEFKRQKQMELQALHKKEEEIFRHLQKQVKAVQMQEMAKHSRTGSSLSSPITKLDSLSIGESDSQNRSDWFRTIPVKLVPGEKSVTSIPAPSGVRVFETRPISSMSEVTDPAEFGLSPNPQTWKRTYIVEPLEPAAKNEILTSKEILDRERFEVDLLKRREAFVEKPKPMVKIHRIGRRWQPPPEQPYIWPTAHSAANQDLENDGSIPGFSGASSANEYRWEPHIHDPGYKYERKRFSPENVPDRSLIRGSGPGTLDEVAKRQTRHLVKPLPDGTHRPQTVFRGPRSTPSGGFYPHAPNAIKIVRKKDLDGRESVSVEGASIDRRSIDSQHAPRPVAPDESLEISILPPHSSTITDRISPRRVDVRGRRDMFETASRRVDHRHRGQRPSADANFMHRQGIHYTLSDSEGLRKKKIDNSIELQLGTQGHSSRVLQRYGSSPLPKQVKVLTPTSQPVGSQLENPKKKPLMRIIRMTPSTTQATPSEVYVSRTATPASSIQRGRQVSKTRTSTRGPA